MSQKYQEKESTGREFVDCTKALCEYTLHQCDLLPEEWQQRYANPLADDAVTMERLTVMANRVYINEKVLSAEQCIAAYQQRDEGLTEALRYMEDFDVKFERLMSKIDIAGQEIRRMKTEMYELLNEIQTENPELEKIKIKLIAHKDSMEYRAANGSVQVRLKLDARKRDYWLSLRAQSEELLRKRIELDRYAINRLKAKLCQ